MKKRNISKQAHQIKTNEIVQPKLGEEIVDQKMLVTLARKIDQDNRRLLKCNHGTRMDCQEIVRIQKSMLLQLQMKKYWQLAYCQILLEKRQKLISKYNLQQSPQNTQFPLSSYSSFPNSQQISLQALTNEKYSKLHTLSQQTNTSLWNKQKQVKYSIDQIQESNKDVIQYLKFIKQNIQCNQKLIESEQLVIDEREKRIEYLKAQEREVFEEKKRSNNLLQEDRGNIRVYCRIRPGINTQDKIEYAITDNYLYIKKEKKQLKSKNQTQQYEYLFEKIFDQDITQRELFDELSQLVQCSVDGKNVCIFAYGQTGSGKTFTMKGQTSEYSIQNMGFIPRSLEYIFTQVSIANEKDYKSNISISISQIYNDELVDLLQLKPEKASKSQNSSCTKKMHGNQRTSSIHELMYLEIASYDEGMILLTKALEQRRTAQTKMNTQSSRSHLIFQIRNQFVNSQINVKRVSSLVMVDLAGSQRQRESQVTGMRQEETKQINKSLTELGKVMRAIKNNEVPSFRSSKLTMALQKYLQGDSKAIMFVNVSPERKDIDQTINSLVFAEGVRETKLQKRTHSMQIQSN